MESTQTKPNPDTVEMEVNQSESTNQADVDEKPTIDSLPTFLNSLALPNITVSINDLLRYTLILVAGLSIILYVFPTQLVLLLLTVLLIVMLTVTLVLRRLRNQPASNQPASQSDRKSFGAQVINLEKLKQVRSHLKNKTT